MTDPQTDIEVIVDPNEPPPAPFRGVEVKGVAKYVMYASLAVAALGIMFGLAGATWGVVYAGITTFALSVIAMLVVGAIERRR